MQRRWVRRLSPRVLVVALCSVAMVVTAVAVSQADSRSGRAVSVAMLSGGDAASLPGADIALPGSSASAEAAPESPPPTEPSTTTTAADISARAATVTAKPQPRPKPCPTSGQPDRPCGPPCPHPGQGTGPDKCPPPPPPPPPTCRQYDIRTGSSQPCPPPCSPYDTAGNTSSTCPQPCPALAAADGRPAPCPPPPCPQPQYDNGVTQSAYACPPPPCAYPTEPAGGTGATQPQVMIYCPPPCYDTPNSAGTSCPPPPPPPCEKDASCPPPCYYAQPAPASTTIAEPVPPSEPCPPPCQEPKACPPPCPSAAPTDQSCTPPCSYEPASSGPAVGAFAPCPAPSGVTGRVTAGPTCPVERPDQPCADKPVETTLRLLRKDGSVAASGKSSADGSFRMLAAPGSYRLVADWPSRIGGCGPVEVTVDYGRFSYADVSCDTGIR